MSIPKRETIIAVKIIDMLGEEVLIKKRVQLFNKIFYINNNYNFV